MVGVKIDGEPGSEVADLIANFPKRDGLPVVGCLPGSGAAAGGICRGDIIIDVNGMPIDSAESYIRARKLDPDAMRVTVLRHGQPLSFTLQLESSTMPAVNARGHFVS